MSRESEKLYEAIGQAADGQIEEAQSPRRRHKKRWIAPLAAVLALAIILTAVLSGPGGSAYALAEPKYPKETVVQFPNRQLGLMDDYLRRSLPRLLDGSKGENRVCSPVNIYLALSMLAEVTAGESRGQILALLGEESMEVQRQRAKELWEQNYLAAGETGASLLASSLWLDEDLDYKRDTVSLLAEEYYASVFRGDLGSEKLNAALRNWLDAQTGGLLKEQTANLVLPADAVLVLAATVYFKGSWEIEFDPADTKKETFTGPGGGIACDFMHSKRTRESYYWGESFTAANLRFTNRRSMLFLLPEEGMAPEELLSEGEFYDFLCGDRSQWQGSELVELRISMPKFDVADDFDLLPVLEALGVTDVQTPGRADFSPIMDSPAFLVKAEHAARVKVDEEGCEAAAYTVMVPGGGGSQEALREVDFTLDRPFLFVILGADGLPLFVGVVNDPAA